MSQHMSELITALQSTTMLAALRTPAFGTRRRDKLAGEEVSSQAGAVASAAMVSVNLLAGADEIHQAIMKVQRQARVAFNHITSTWDDEGWRLLPSALFDRCMVDVVKPYKPQMEELKERLKDEAPAIIKRAQEGLGDFAARHILPTAEEMAAAYDLKVEFQPIPDGSRFQGLPDKTIEMLARHVENRARAKAEGAMHEPLERMTSALEHMLMRLQAYEEREAARNRGEKVGKQGTFKDTLVTNVQELAGIIAHFNLTGSPGFEEIALKAQALSQGIDPASLRESRNTRNKAIEIGTDLLGAIRALNPGSK